MKETIIGDYLGTTIGIHSPIPYKNQTEEDLVVECLWGCKACQGLGFRTDSGLRRSGSPTSNRPGVSVLR